MTDTAPCPRHGMQLVTDSGTSAGFTGAPIYWATLACGCPLVDDDLDTLAWVE